MTVQSVTVQLPTKLYNRLKQRADQAHHSIEADIAPILARIPRRRALIVRLVYLSPEGELAFACGD